MSENKDRNNSDLPDPEHHLSEEEIEQALAGFEEEFRESSQQDKEGSSDQTNQEEADGSRSDFDLELEGLIGNRAKVAVIVTQLASAELLAAFCQLCDISAWCIQADEGAVAVLRNLDGDGPEAAIRDLTTVVSGLSAILAVNRADKLEATLWINGKPGKTYAPPMLFMYTADFVENLMIGTTTVERLKQDGVQVLDSGDYDREKAMSVIAAHTKFGAGGSPHQGRVN